MRKLIKGEGGGADVGLISRGVEICGDVTFAERLHVDGKVIGKLSSEKGVLVIGETGQIEAEVNVGTCVIHGQLNGDLNARERVEIYRTGRVYGDVTTPVLFVEEGAVFNGAVKMSRAAAGQMIQEVEGEARAARSV
jgi:cytoskeletal protein CcmA (bactofilin family)